MPRGGGVKPAGEGSASLLANRQGFENDGHFVDYLKKGVV